jgi:hypothetical protein
VCPYPRFFKPPSALAGILTDTKASGSESETAIGSRSNGPEVRDHRSQPSARQVRRPFQVDSSHREGTTEPSP